MCVCVPLLSYVVSAIEVNIAEEAPDATTLQSPQTPPSPLPSPGASASTSASASAASPDTSRLSPRADGVEPAAAATPVSPSASAELPVSPCGNREEYRAHLQESVEKKRARTRDERRKAMMEELQTKCVSIEH